MTQDTAYLVDERQPEMEPMLPLSPDERAAILEAGARELFSAPEPHRRGDHAPAAVRAGPGDRDHSSANGGHRQQ